MPNVLPIIVTLEQAPSSKVIGASNKILKKAMFAQQTITGRRTAAWNEPSLQHGHCYIDADGVHITLNRFRLNAWGTALVIPPSVSFSMSLANILV